MRRALLLIGLVLLCCPSVASADDAAPLFDTSSVAQVAITLPESSRTALNADPDTYQPAALSVTAGGTSYGPFTVELKLKGNSSFRDLDHKAAFKIKLAKGQPLLGLKKLTLNNMIQDASMVHEALAYKTFRAVGVPAPRAGYAFVRVNGEAYGVYLNLETLDDVSLPQRFPSTGHLYENGFATDLKDDDWKWFEVDEGDEDDRSDLQALTDAAKGSGDFSDRMAGKADLAEMVTMWATEKYIGQWDGYAGVDRVWTPNNYYLHSTTGGLFSMLPWGTDQTWVDRINFDEGGVLFRQCRGDESCEDSFRETLARVTRTATGLGLQSEVRRLGAMLAPYQAQDPRKESTQVDIDWWLQKAVQYMDQRPRDVAALLGDPSLIPPGSPAPGGEAPHEPGEDRTSRAGSPPARSRPRPVPAATTARAGLRVGRVDSHRPVISTRMRVLRRGSVSQRMTMTVRGRSVTACYVSSRRLGTGLHSLHCRLSRPARRHLRSGKVRLTARTRLSGTPLVRTRLTLARCHGC